MSTSFERPRFFPGQLLAVDDLAQEQKYFREKLRRHNRMLHGWGIVSGLELTPEGSKLVVAPGYALGPDGDEISIEQATTIDVCTKDDATVYLAVRYAEELTTPVPMPGSEAGEVEYSRIRDSYELKVLTELPTSHDEPWVVLGDVVVSGGEVTDVKERHRRYVPGQTG